MVTNGYINKEPLEQLIPWMDAFSIDLKGFTEEFYRDNCGASLEQVLDTCRHVYRSKVHVELTYLLIPGLNDSSDEVREFCLWVVQNLSSNVPVHFFRFQPFHLLSHLQEQSITKMKEAYRIARESGIKFPYLAGVIGDTNQNTYCPDCGALLIARTSEEVAEKVIAKGEEVSRFCPTYAKVDMRITHPRCPTCGTDIPLFL